MPRRLPLSPLRLAGGLALGACALAIASAAGAQAVREAGAAPDRSRPQRFSFTAGRDRFRVTREGQGLRTTPKGRTTSFRLASLPGFRIERLWTAPYRGDLLCIYQTTDGQEGAGQVTRLDRRTLRSRWTATIPGFNLGPALLDGSAAYVTAIGFAGRLNLETGRYTWKHPGLREKYRGHFNAFQQPRAREKEVLFTESALTGKGGKPKRLRVEKQAGTILGIEDAS